MKGTGRAEPTKVDLAIAIILGVACIVFLIWAWGKPIPPEYYDCTESVCNCKGKAER